MKKLQLIALFSVMAFALNAQVPQGINYQAAVRNSSGQALVSAAVTMRFGIYSGAGATLKVYEETQSLTTNAAGIANCIIGKGTVLTGTFNTIAWGSDQFHLKVEVNSGSGFVDMGTQQLISVPYALHAGSVASTATISPSQITAGGATTNQGLVWNGTAWTPTSQITGITAGNGLTGGGTSGNVTLDAKNNSAMWNANQIQGIAVTSGATTGQILKYNGTTWAAVNELITAAGTGVTISSGTINTPWTIAGNHIYKNNTGNVGIGATAPTELLHVQSATANAYGLTEATNSTYNAGFVAKTTGGPNDYLQLVKHGSGASGTTAGALPLANLSTLTAGAGAGTLLIQVVSANPMVFATNNAERMRIAATGEVGIGVNAPSTMSKLNIIGVGSINNSTFPYHAAVIAEDTLSGRTSSTGIYGRGGWRGLWGHNKGTASGGQAIGVYGLLEGTKYTNYGYGVMGENQGSGGKANYGVYGIASGAGSLEYGVYGLATDGSKYSFGVTGISNSATASTLRLGVYGSGVSAGILGTATGGSGYLWINTLSSLTPGAVGITRTVTSGRPVGLLAHASNTTSFGASGLLTICDSNQYNYGVEAYANNGSSSNFAIYASAANASPYAGYFAGAIYATSASSSIKSFKIDHPQDPENKYLYHSSIESPDMMNIYNGNIVTDAEGNATIQLPSYFMVLNKDFKYQLTCMGQFAQAIVTEEIKDNKFVIKTDKPNVKVSWMVTGVRQDAAANYARVQPEVEKPASEKGFYLMPEAYGFGPERNSAWYYSSQNKNRPQPQAEKTAPQPAPAANPVNNPVTPNSPINR